MSQNIALTLSLGGTQKAVSNIAQLEEAIRQAREELKGVELGSTAFNKLASDVKVAENRLKDLNKQVEGKDLEARIGDFGKLGGAIGASFASATAAIQLFGGESEDSLKAVTQAQNALTLALGAKAAAEGAYVVKQYASIAATKIQTVVTNTLNASTRAFFATLLANPFTLILVGLTALATAMYAFGEDTEDATDKVSDLNKEIKDLKVLQTQARQSTIAETSAIQKFQGIVNNTNVSLRVKKAAYEELQKLVPTLKNLTLEQAEAEGVLNEYIADQIRLIELRAEAKALEELLNKQAAAALEKDRQKIEQLIIQREIERPKIVERIRLGSQSIEQQNREIALYDKQTKQIRDRFNPQERFAKLTVEILDIQGKQTEIIKAQTKAIDDNTQAEKDAYEAKLKAQFLLGEISKAELEQLLRLEKFEMTDVQIIKDLQEKIATQEKWIATLGLEKTRLQERDEVIEANRTINDEALESFVNFTTAYQDYLKEITSGKGATKNFAEEIAALIDAGQVTRKSLEGLVNDETLKQFDGYVNNLNAVARAFDEVLKFGPPVSDTFRQYSDALRTANDESLTAEQREAARGLAVAKSAQALKEYTDAVKKAGTQLTDEQIAVEFGIIQKAITDGTVEIAKFENGVIVVAEKVRELNSRLEANVANTEKAFNVKQIQEFVKGLEEGVQQIQMVLGALQQSTQAYFDFQFDTLEKRYKRITEGIIGDSEEASKKRIEAEKSYQAERERLEKNAAKTQLRISLAQSLANTAEAVTRVFAQTGIGGIIAGSLVAAASGAQSIIIAQQLAAVDSYQRGGIMRRQGGGFLVNGPSHEMGGVKFQGGGVELEGNEAVINRVSTINYMGLLDQINQAGGGRPISSLANESRLIEAIAKQRSTPIRAYVVESDITAKQETARRLERLSQF
jgi:hypothetical protein